MFMRVNDVRNMICSYEVYMINVIENSNCVYGMSLVLKLNIGILNFEKLDVETMVWDNYS